MSSKVVFSVFFLDSAPRFVNSSYLWYGVCSSNSHCGILCCPQSLTGLLRYAVITLQFNIVQNNSAYNGFKFHSRYIASSKRRFLSNSVCRVSVLFTLTIELPSEWNMTLRRAVSEEKTERRCGCFQRRRYYRTMRTISIELHWAIDYIGRKNEAVIFLC